MVIVINKRIRHCVLLVSPTDHGVKIASVQLLFYVSWSALCSLGVATFAEPGLSFSIHIIIFLSKFGHHLYKSAGSLVSYLYPVIICTNPQILAQTPTYLSLDHLLYALPLLLQPSIR